MKQWFRGAAVLTTGIVMALSPALAGPKPGGPPPAPAMHGGAPAQMNPLGLTPAQQQKLQALSQQMMPDIQAAMKSAKTELQARKAMMAVQNKWNPKILAILTPAQRVKFNKLRADALKKEAAATAQVKPVVKPAPKKR